MARARKSGMPKSSAAPSVPQTAAPPPGKKPQHINLVDDDDDDDDNNKGDQDDDDDVVGHQMGRGGEGFSFFSSLIPCSSMDLLLHSETLQ